MPAANRAHFDGRLEAHDLIHVASGNNFVVTSGYVKDRGFAPMEFVVRFYRDDRTYPCCQDARIDAPPQVCFGAPEWIRWSMTRPNRNSPAGANCPYHWRDSGESEYGEEPQRRAHK
jgi:hypothetical protein